MRILHICCFNSEKICGPAQSVDNLAQAQRKNHSVTSVTVYNAFGKSFSNSSLFNGLFQNNSDATNEVESLIKSSDLVSFHGVYIILFPAIAQLCRRHGVPYVITPRSHLMRAAMKKSWLKKTVCNFVVFDRFVRNASARHFLTEDESQNSRFSSLPYFVAGNGVHLPEAVTAPETESVLFQFIGRKDVTHKGLDLLLKGVSSAAQTIRDSHAKVKINGPCHRGGEMQLAKILRDLKLQDIVELGDAVRGQEKSAALQQTSVFLHTSRYEGQPQAVLEAWAAGRPALLTTGTNLGSVVREHSTGWLTGFSNIEIASSIRQILDNPEEISAKAQAARSFALQNLTWEQVADKTINGYKTVLQGEKRSIAA